MKTLSPLGPVLLAAGLWFAAPGCDRPASDAAPERPRNVPAAQPGPDSPDSAAEPPSRTATDPETANPIDSQTTAPDPTPAPDPVPPALADTDNRALPPIPDRDDTAEETDPPASETVQDWEREGPLPEEIAGKAFLPPPEATPLAKQGRLWVDRKRSRVFVDGYVALKRGPLEMFACPVGTKEHESIVAVLAKSREVHAALLAVEANPGTPVRFRPEFLPPTGQVIRVWVCWYDSKNQFHAVDAREWIEDLQNEKAMTAEWVFAGSGFWQDPDDKREYYRADSGDMICVSNFSSAMLDVAISSSADADSLRFVPFESKIPDRETPVRLVLVPVPFPTDTPNLEIRPDRLDVPTARDVPRAP